MENRWPALALDAAAWPAPGDRDAAVMLLDLRGFGWQETDSTGRSEPSAGVDRHALAGLLDPVERARGERLVFRRDQVRHTVAHAILRAVLGRHLGLGTDSPARLRSEVRYTIAADGKPSLAGGREARLQFNLSHSGPWVLIGATRAAAIGVDVESHRPLPDLDALAAAHFATGERAALAGLPEAARAHAFHRIWSRKEAYVKALGTGLATPLHRFEVSADAVAPHALRGIDGDAAAAAAWTVCDLPGIPSASAAVAVCSPGVAVRTYRLVVPEALSSSKQNPL